MYSLQVIWKIFVSDIAFGLYEWTLSLINRNTLGPAAACWILSPINRNTLGPAAVTTSAESCRKEAFLPLKREDYETIESFPAIFFVVVDEKHM